MVGSTNHLELLDPGISKRPSRFDRKYLFPNPDLKQRVKYCRYWQGKLKGNADVEFPDILCLKIAGITGGFSFAYIQEAFVATLLVLASQKEEAVESSLDDWQLVDQQEVAAVEPFGGGNDDDDDDDDELEKYFLWREIKKQVATLRKELDGKARAVAE